MNPRAAINDLLPFQGSPFGQLGYFSLVEQNGRRTHSPLAGCHPASSMPDMRRLPVSIKDRDSYGEDGIRTHVPVKANGFQDRLVMTTSIPLHIQFEHKKSVHRIVSARSILTNVYMRVNHFLREKVAKKNRPF